MTMANYVHHPNCEWSCEHWDCMGCCGCGYWWEGLWYFDEDGVFHDATDPNYPDYEAPMPYDPAKHISWELIRDDTTEGSPSLP